MKQIAYLVNRYPAVSHTFIRREIRALEALGWSVLRYSIRSTKGEVSDPDDLEEAEQTKVLLNASIWSFCGSILTTLFTRPVSFVRALTLASRLGWRSDRGLLWHFIYLAEACLLRDWLATAKASHLHAHFGTNSTSVALLCHALGGPSYSFTVHGPEEFDKPLAIGLPLKIQHAKFVVAISNYCRSQLFRWCSHADWSKIEIVRCGVDDSFLNAPLTPVPDVPTLVCVGRLCEQKGQLLLIEAVAILRERQIPVKLRLVGDGELRPELEALAQRLQIVDAVTITGWRTGAEVREEILAARGLVLPSFAEGLPVVIMEALALGRPVISTYIAGIPELVIPGECGWLVPAGDVKALADALGCILSDSIIQLSSLGNTGSGLVRERHEITSIAKNLSNQF